ncbi:MAG TPA: pyrroline-5-carboxylate reductase [Anaerolineales bacterium]|nr:pyrroline-5-carboxylate reductase [Anaerolineales bacterium]
MFEDCQIAFIGSGAMAEAMISGVIRNQLAQPQNLRTADPRVERLDVLRERYALQTFTDNVEAASSADVVVLSVKPQVLDRVMNGLKGHLKPDALVLSIVAGAPIKKIAAGLAHSIVVRSMPNTPAQIGKGITVWTAAESVPEQRLDAARQILGALGEQVFLGDEYYLDMATALSGSGPAYVFLFMEAMVDAGVHLGFERHIAEKLVVETVRGAVDYFTLRDDPVHLARLRNQVTSPGGTSAAALYYLEKAGFRTAISRAVWAAYERSRELGADPKPSAPDAGEKQN